MSKTRTWDELTDDERAYVQSWPSWRKKDAPLEPIDEFAERMKQYRFRTYEGKVVAERG